MGKSEFEPNPATLRPSYRPDIDGLRAVAVLLVVVNHLRDGWAPGGFVGVDVFFVISGFLITGMILSQKSAGQFRFGPFYARRARRLFPALFVIIFATLVAGYFLLLPSDYSQLAASALSAVGISSNFYFWRTTGGYFSQASTSFPLLHVWSLSLEEQFYLIWPAMLILLTQTRRLWIPVLALGVSSFIFAQIGAGHGSTAAYFLLPARVGEFMVGALLALWPTSAGSQSRPLMANASGLGGLLLIACSVWLIDRQSPFPGLLALIPCFGAALVIAAPKFGPGIAADFLSCPLMVGLGRISYSVYLWHWPLISLLHLSRVTITFPIALGVLTMSLGLGALSWRFLEREFRAWLEQGSRAAMAAMLAGSVGLVALAGLILWRAGLPERFPFALLTQEQLTAERARYWNDLPAVSNSLTLEDKGRRLLLVGNSHAFDLAYALQEAGQTGKIQLFTTSFVCFNFGHDAVFPKSEGECRQRWSEFLNSSALQAATTVYLHDNWGGYSDGGLDGALHEIRQVTNVPIVVFGPKMTFTDDVLAISKTAQSRRVVTASAINVFARRYYDPDKVARDQALKRHFAASPLPGVEYVSLLDRQCGAALNCDILSRDGRYLYFDGGHLTLEGSRRLGARLRTGNPELF